MHWDDFLIGAVFGFLTGVAAAVFLIWRFIVWAT